MNLCDLNCLDCCELKWLQRKFDEIPSLNGYATQAWVEENFQPK